MWPSLTESEKDLVVAELRGNFDHLRQAECPWPDFYGCVDGGGIHHYLFYSQKADQNHLGPYTGEAAFVEGLTSNYRALVERNNRPDFKARYYETYLSRVLRNHRPVLTHGDVSKRNIMITEAPSRRSHEGERSFHIVLVDWEAAGWFPEFWEYFCAASMFDLSSWEDDWCWRVGQFLEVCPAEAAIMRMFDKDTGC